MNAGVYAGGVTVDLNQIAWPAGIIITAALVVTALRGIHIHIHRDDDNDDDEK